jgi:plasmid maintenance system antidote protein VapI
MEHTAYADLKAYVEATSRKHTEIAADLGCDPSMVSHVVAGNKPLSRRMAIKLFRERGVRIGPLVNATDEEIDTLERFEVAA